MRVCACVLKGGVIWTIEQNEQCFKVFHWEFACSELPEKYTFTDKWRSVRHTTKQETNVYSADWFICTNTHKQWSSMSIGISLSASLSGSPVRPGLIELASGSPSLALLLRSHMATRCEFSHNGAPSATLSSSFSLHPSLSVCLPVTLQPNKLAFVSMRPLFTKSTAACRKRSHRGLNGTLCINDIQK